MTRQDTSPDDPCGTLAETPAKTASSLPPLSYGFRLFKLRPDEDPHVTAERGAENYPTTPPDPQKEALKRRAADSLISRTPGLQICQFPYQQIAHFEHIPVEKARCKYRHLELNGLEGGNGIQIILRDDEASVTVPFWHEGLKAAQVFRELWSHLEIIGRETGFLVYDPQIGRMFDPAAGYGEALARYTETVRQLREARPAEGFRMEIRQLIKPEACGVVLVAVPECGAPSGFAEVSIYHDSADGANPVPVAYLTGWYVDAASRGRGIGRRLLQSAEQWAAARGFRELASGLRAQKKPGILTPRSSGFGDFTNFTVAHDNATKAA